MKRGCFFKPKSKNSANTHRYGYKCYIRYNPHNQPQNPLYSMLHNSTTLYKLAILYNSTYFLYILYISNNTTTLLSICYLCRRNFAQNMSPVFCFTFFSADL